MELKQAEPCVAHLVQAKEADIEKEAQATANVAKILLRRCPGLRGSKCGLIPQDWKLGTSFPCPLHFQLCLAPTPPAALTSLVHHIPICSLVICCPCEVAGVTRLVPSKDPKSSRPDALKGERRQTLYSVGADADPRSEIVKSKTAYENKEVTCSAAHSAGPTLRITTLYLHIDPHVPA